MSKLKSFLRVLTLGIAFSYPTQTNINNPYPLHPNQISSSYEIQESQRESQISVQTPNNETIRPQQRPSTITQGTFEEYFAYLRWTHQVQHISTLPNSQILQLRSFALQILSKDEHSRTQNEKDFIFLWNSYRYQLESPLALSRFSEIIPTISSNPQIISQILLERMPQDSFNSNSTSNNVSTITFYPNQVSPQLNEFILNSLANPSSISNNMIQTIHPSYYQLIVGLLLIENNFGRNTTSSAGARGPFQIKPDTIAWVERYFRLSGNYTNLNQVQKSQRELETGFLHIFQLALFFDINLSREPSVEEIALITFTYFQGINSYSRILTDLDSRTQHQLEQYVLPIISLVTTSIITISQNRREEI